MPQDFIAGGGGDERGGRRVVEGKRIFSWAKREIIFQSIFDTVGEY